MCVGLSAKVVKISEGTAVVERSFRTASGRPGARRLCDGSRRRCNCKDHR